MGIPLWQIIVGIILLISALVYGLDWLTRVISTLDRLKKQEILEEERAKSQHKSALTKP